MQVFTNEFIEAVKSCVETHVKSGTNATRGSICSGIGAEGYENCISTLIENGGLPGYKLVKRAGVVPIDYQSKSAKKAAKSDDAEQQQAESTSEE